MMHAGVRIVMSEQTTQFSYSAKKIPSVHHALPLIVRKKQEGGKIQVFIVMLTVYYSTDMGAYTSQDNTTLG
tara:strand:- start:284 stop:499 length:216 start_codon:yes stop_codon:yes gene_type:complete